jgi:hypothetical protein
MIQIKNTKNVGIWGDVKEVVVSMKGAKIDTSLFIPARLVFQVKRGLESYIQKFYRKHVNK